VKLLSCRWRVIHESAVELGCAPRGLALAIAGVSPYIVGSRSYGANCIRSVASGTRVRWCSASINLCT
jgi:hypothetical protein